MAMPHATRPAPAPTRAARVPRRACRACTHAPAVQVRVAAVSARPASVAGCPRNTVRKSGSRVSAPKNATLMSAIAATAAGSPGRPRSVPGGRSRRRLGPAVATPSAPSAAAHAGVVRSEPEQHDDAAGREQHGVRDGAAHAIRGRLRAARCATRRSAGSASAAHTARIGTRPRNTRRQLAWSATSPLRPGPTRPGTTHAVDSSASMRGWRVGGIAARDACVDDGRECAGPEALDRARGDECRHRRRRAAGDESAARRASSRRRRRRTARDGRCAVPTRRCRRRSRA